MELFRYAGIALALAAGAAQAAPLGPGAAGARLHERSTALVAVAGSAQASAVEAGSAAVGTWSGRWTNDVTGGAGTVTIRIESASGGSVSGSGEVSGGPCARPFTVSGRYRDSLVQLELALPEQGADCPAATVSISMRIGRGGDKTIALGHWANTVDGVSAGRAFGFVEFVKQ